jgi:glycosyltransferase involved in cell wall biosynthesis
MGSADNERMAAPNRTTAPVVSVVIPTMGRADYLEVTLRSLAAQDLEASYEVIVVDDGSTDRTPEVLSRAGMRVVRHPARRGLNAARNSGIRAARADLIAFVDDDVEAPREWLGALLEGTARYPDAEAFGGPIRPRLEGLPPRGCGRDSQLITSLDLGPEDRETERVWGANLAVRRAAVTRVGQFDESLGPRCGDEEEWLVRLHEAGGKIVYLAAAGLDHRRTGDDSRMRSLARAAFTRGRAARANDRRRRTEPSLARELRVLVGCCWHTVRRSCPQGLIMAAHSSGRVTETVRER